VAKSRALAGPRADSRRLSAWGLVPTALRVNRNLGANTRCPSARQTIVPKPTRHLKVRFRLFRTRRTRATHPREGHRGVSSSPTPHKGDSPALYTAWEGRTAGAAVSRFRWLTPASSSPEPGAISEAFETAAGAADPRNGRSGPK